MDVTRLDQKQNLYQCRQYFGVLWGFLNSFSYILMVIQSVYRWYLQVCDPPVLPGKHRLYYNYQISQTYIYSFSFSLMSNTLNPYWKPCPCTYNGHSQTKDSIKSLSKWNLDSRWSKAAVFFGGRGGGETFLKVSWKKRSTYFLDDFEGKMRKSKGNLHLGTKK